MPYQQEDQSDPMRGRFIKYVCQALAHTKAKYEKGKTIRKIIIEENYKGMGGAPLVYDSYFPLLLENDELARAMAKLKKKERQILALKYVYDLSFQQIAKRLDLHYKGVAATYYRAVSKIRAYIKEGNDGSKTDADTGAKRKPGGV